MNKEDLRAVFRGCEPDIDAVSRLFKEMIEKEITKSEALHQEYLSAFHMMVEQEAEVDFSDKNQDKHEKKEALQGMIDRYFQIHCHNMNLNSKLREFPRFRTTWEVGPIEGDAENVTFCDVWCPW